MAVEHGAPSATTTEPKAQQHGGQKEDNRGRGKISRRRSKRKFIGFSERMEMKRRQRLDKPRNWVERKLTVGIVIGVAGYAWYVYIGRFCVPMLRRDENALGGRGMGVAFTIVFCLFGLIFWWTYVTLLFQAPGFARDFVQKSPAPQSEYQTYSRTAPSAFRSRGHGYDSNDDFCSNEDDFIGGTPYAEISPSPSHETPSTHQQRPMDVEKHADLNVPAAGHRPREPPSSHNATFQTPVRKLSKKRTPVRVSEPEPTYESSPHSQNVRHNSGGERSTDETAVTSAETGSVPLHPLARMVDPTSTPSPNANAKEYQPPQNTKSAEDGLPPPMFSRRPPTYPMLLPEYRYCQKDGIVKPLRAHHCRACGTCVLMYDHHCPWIGQCVGAYNHKFFVNFLEWSTLWTLWVFATLLAKEVTTASDPGKSIDPQILVIIALSAFFSLFTSVLLGAHIRMIVFNETSVESLGVSHMRERESEILTRIVSCWNCPKRRAKRKEWDWEWGELHTEGNIWWLGNAKANWEYRMGKSWIGWILPVGKSEGDGLTYPTNPRFDRDGRWRRRHEWPPELQ
ncbi:hypothetical protein ACEPAF_8942 [Sanghuangporus sanghuang]